MIIDHGTWVAYTPAAPPTEHNILYAQRETPEAEDWYQYQSTFAAGTVVITTQRIDDGTAVVEIIQAATFDPSMIFPAGFRVIEETAYVGNDPQSYFGRHIYDPVTQTIGAVYVPPPPPATQLSKTLDAILARLDALERK